MRSLLTKQTPIYARYNPLIQRAAIFDRLLGMADSVIAAIDFELTDPTRSELQAVEAVGLKIAVSHSRPRSI